MASTDTPAAAASAPSTVKVFVGNLSYSTTADRLKETFKEAGQVINAILVTRGTRPPRPVGYAFLEFPDEAVAKKAIDLFNKTKIDEREVNVELARAHEPRPPRTRSYNRRRQPRDDDDAENSRPPPRRFNRRQRRPAPREAGEEVSQEPQENAPVSEEQNGDQRPPRRFNRRQRRPAPREASEEVSQEPQENAPVSEEQNGDQRPPQRRRRNPGPNRRIPRERRQNGGDRDNNAGDNNDAPAEAPRRTAGGATRNRRRNDNEEDEFGGHRQQNRRPFRPRFQRRRNPRRDPSDEVPSKTMLFVANLHYDLDDNGLFEAFKDIKIVSAHVVKDKNGKSKGFGFVECADEEQQKAASVKIDGRLVQGRPISVKIGRASSERKPEAAEESQPAEPTN